MTDPHSELLTRDLISDSHRFQTNGRHAWVGSRRSRVRQLGEGSGRTHLEFPSQRHRPRIIDILRHAPSRITSSPTADTLVILGRPKPLQLGNLTAEEDVAQRHRLPWSVFIGKEP